jgi:hypothetical protein
VYTASPPLSKTLDLTIFGVDDVISTPHNQVWLQMVLRYAIYADHFRCTIFVEIKVLTLLAQARGKNMILSFFDVLHTINIFSHCAEVPQFELSACKLYITHVLGVKKHDTF